MLISRIATAAGLLIAWLNYYYPACPGIWSSFWASTASYQAVLEPLTLGHLPGITAMRIASMCLRDMDGYRRQRYIKGVDLCFCSLAKPSLGHLSYCLLHTPSVWLTSLISFVNSNTFRSCIRLRECYREYSYASCGCMLCQPYLLSCLLTSGHTNE